MSGSLLEALALKPLRRAEASAAADPDTRSRARTAMLDAQRAWRDYLDLRDSIDDAARIAAALEQAERDLATWRSEFAPAAAAEQREKMSLLGERIAIERAEFDTLMGNLRELDVLFERRDAAVDAPARAAVQREIEAAFRALPG